MSKPDLVVANEDQTDVIYVEYKSTSSKKDSWINSWGYAVQLHSTVRAIEQTLNVRPTGVIVQGLYKGFESYGKQSSPFCYAYHRAGVPPFNRDEWSYEYRPGLKRYPVWEREGGVKAWVEAMAENLLADQFPRTPVIFINDTLVDNFFQQQRVREETIELSLELLESRADDPGAVNEILNTAFPQKFDQCYPYFGKPCSYRKVCHGQISNPLEQGFVLRESHHQLEREAHEANSGE